MCELDRDEERQSFLFRETVSLLLTYTGDPDCCECPFEISLGEFLWVVSKLLY